MPPAEKSSLHPRNPHRAHYDFPALIQASPDLAPFVRPNPYGNESIDFANPTAVKALNRALLKLHYGIEHWDIPEGYLCPPVPGRADYIHHAADLLGSSNQGKIPSGKRIQVLDIGVGANCIYPIIGNRAYGWTFVGTEVEQVAIEAAREIVERNPALKGSVEIRVQAHAQHILRGVVRQDEYFDLVVCNPPFHASAEEAQAGTLRKLSNLKGKRVTKAQRNFGGRGRELWCEGGEAAFVGKMISESRENPFSCFWYTTLVSKESNLKGVYAALEIAEASEVKTIPMSLGNKQSRIVAWTFLSPKQQKVWIKTRWA